MSDQQRRIHTHGRGHKKHAVLADHLALRCALPPGIISPSDPTVVSVQVHPVSLGIFNFVNAWSMMFWPVMLADKKGQACNKRFPLWFGTQVQLSYILQAANGDALAETVMV